MRLINDRDLAFALQILDDLSRPGRREGSFLASTGASAALVSAGLSQAFGSSAFRPIRLCRLGLYGFGLRRVRLVGLDLAGLGLYDLGGRFGLRLDAGFGCGLDPGFCRLVFRLRAGLGLCGRSIRRRGFGGLLVGRSGIDDLRGRLLGHRVGRFRLCFV